MRKVKFNIQGMTCSSCSAHVEKAVNKLEGIQSVNVNLLSNHMIVEYDENIMNNQKIIHAVVDAGYGASLDTKNEKGNDKESSEASQQEDSIQSMKQQLIISICFLIPLMYLAMHHMVYEWLGLPIPQMIQNIFDGRENAIIFGVTQFLLLLPIIYVNRHYFIVGFKRLWKRTPNMDSLIAIGSSASIIYGIFAIYKMGYGLGHNVMDLVDRYSMELYFESAGTILTLITVGKYLETKSKGKTSDAIRKLMNLAPKTAVVLRDSREIEIGIEEVIQGDILVIKPGGGIPVDGMVIEGNSSIDQSSITGESIPVEKVIGDNVISGTINKNGYFKMKATKVGEDTTLSQMIRLVEEASNSKAPIARLADKVSGIFVPCVILIAILASIFWIMNGQSFEFALSVGIAVLVISCPCALGLATPVAIMVGTGKGAENGILIKSAQSLELLHLVDTVVLDKTGTITQGKPKVMDVITNQILMSEAPIGNGKIKFIGNRNNYITAENTLLKIAGSLEKNSEHPLAEAILEKVKQTNITLAEVEEFTAVPGRGVKGKIDGIYYLGGNIAFMQENNIRIEETSTKAEGLEKEGKTLLYFAKENHLMGIIAVADTIKPTSKKAIDMLKQSSIEVVMLTGDNRIVAETIGNQLNIEKVIAEVLPQDKEKEVVKLQSEGKKVAFVGDGINDSPALVRADVGVAIGSGTDIAIESADIVLMKDNLLDVVNAIRLSKSVIKNIKMNLFWAFFYNAIGIPVAAGAFYLSFGLKLSPMIGAAAMSLSSVCVVTNALRLRRFKGIEIKKDFKDKENRKMKVILIEGMQCNHCKMSVEKALKAIEGVISVEVSLENKNAKIEVDKEVKNSIIEEAIQEAGFEVVKIM